MTTPVINTTDFPLDKVEKIMPIGRRTLPGNDRVETYYPHPNEPGRILVVTEFYRVEPLAGTDGRVCARRRDPELLGHTVTSEPRANFAPYLRGRTP
jgi:hypothetical protein